RDREVLIEDEVEHLALPRRELRKRPRELLRPLPRRSLRVWTATTVRDLGGEVDVAPAEDADDRPPTMFTRGHPDHTEEPRLEARPSIESSTPVEHFEVDVLEHVFGDAPVATATGQRPTEARLVKRSEFILESGCIPHPRALGWIPRRSASGDMG